MDLDLDTRRRLTFTSSTVACARVISEETEHGTKAPSEKASTCVSVSVLAKICAKHKIKNMMLQKKSITYG